LLGALFSKIRFLKIFAKE